MPKKIKRRGVTFKTYKKKHPNVVVMYSEPDYVEVARSKEQLKQWTTDVINHVGISFPGIDLGGPLSADDHNHTNTGWKDSDGGRHLDFDCDPD